MAAPYLVLIRLLFYLFSSDASGTAFDYGALEHGSVLDDAVAAVEDRCGTAASSLAKAKEVLQRFYKEIIPKGVALGDIDALADALSEDATVASVGMAMAMASGAELDLPHVTSRMAAAPDGSEVVFAPFASRCKRYGRSSFTWWQSTQRSSRRRTRAGSLALRPLQMRVLRLFCCSLG